MPAGLARQIEDDDLIVEICGRSDRVAEQVEQRLGEELRIGREAHRLGLNLDPRIDLAFSGIGQSEVHDLLGPAAAAAAAAAAALTSN